MKKRAKLKDIAESLNISIATVSRALNDKYDINADTKKEVLRVAEEMNYRPNPMAVSLRTNRYNVIGVVLPSIDHYFFSTVLKGVMNKAHKANYLVIVGESNHDTSKENSIMEQFISHGVTGVIISPTMNSTSEDHFTKFRNKRIPFVLVDRPLVDDRDPFVRYDDPNGAFLAVEHLIDQGYSQIGCIKGNDKCVISNARFTGYLKALDQYGLEASAKHVKTCINLDSKNDGYHLGMQLLLSKNKPDAIFTVTDEVAAGVYLAAKELDIDIPKDLGLVGYSNSKVSTHLAPQLSTVEQPGVEMGEEAFDFLQQIMLGNNTLLKRTFDARLIIRGSSTKHASLKKVTIA